MEKVLIALAIAWIISELCIYLAAVQGRSSYFIVSSAIVVTTLVGGFLAMLPA